MFIYTGLLRVVDNEAQLAGVMGHANVGITDRVYKHLYDRESAEDAFRSAMSGAKNSGS